MTRYRIEFWEPSEAQIQQVVDGWLEHGGNPRRLEEAIVRALDVLSDFPDAGTTADHLRLGLQQYPLRRTKHMIYYEVDRAARVVRILAIWHTSRGSGPPL